MDHVDTMREMQEKWAAALESDHFAGFRGPQRPAHQDRPEDFQDFQHNTKLGVKVNDELYWDIVARSMKHANDVPDVTQVFQEETKKSPNPIRTATAGMDQAPVVTPNWIDGEDLEKLAKMKMDLHALGDKLATADAKMEESKAKGLCKQIKALQSQIDELSDSLAPDIKQDAQS